MTRHGPNFDERHSGGSPTIASPAPVVRVTKLSQIGDVAGIARDLADAAPGPVDLDLTGLDALGSSGRALPVETTLVTNLLLGAYSAVSISSVSTPHEPAIRSQMFRAGLPDLLARRAVPAHGLSPNIGSSVWSRDWIAGERNSLLPEIDAPLAAERLFVFVNAHRQAVGYFQELADRQAAMPWLGELLPLPRAREDKAERRQFISSVAQAIVQLLDNQGRHAFRGGGSLEDREPWLGARTSYVAVALTKGGGEVSWNRLHILAFDNGYGIPRTLRWAHKDLDLPGADLVRTVLERRFAERNIAGHNGIGLWWLHDLCCTRPRSHLTVLTEDDLDPAGRRAIVITSDGTSDSGWRVHEAPEPELPIRGTVVSATIEVPSFEGLPRRRRLVPEDQGVLAS